MGILGLKFGSDSTSNTSTTVDNYDQKQYNTTTTDSNNSVTNITDGGAIDSMAKTMQLLGIQTINNGVTQVKNAYDYADHIFDSAMVFANNSQSISASAFNQAAQMTKDTLTGARVAYSDALGATKAAYADAKGTTDAQKQIILGVLAVAALFALVTLKNKG